MKNKNLKTGISLCMIVKNEERSLARCINSAKSLFDQLIIIDTGSNDDTVKIAKEFDADVHHFQWCDDFAAARNESIKYAKYQWILFLDADEIIDKNSLRELIMARVVSIL